MLTNQAGHHHLRGKTQNVYDTNFFKLNSAIVLINQISPHSIKGGLSKYVCSIHVVYVDVVL